MLWLNVNKSIRRKPALLTGTSTEYLGKRPLPKIMRDRPVVILMGPKGVGKTRVAYRIAGETTRYLDTSALQHAILRRVRTGAWSKALIKARGLILDGPVWLRNRPGMVDLIVELLRARGTLGRHTVVCQADTDCSIDLLIAAAPRGTLALVGLRFPKGKRGRLRFARRMCDEKGIDRIAARGTDQIAPWRYDRVIEVIEAQKPLILPPIQTGGIALAAMHATISEIGVPGAKTAATPASVSPC
jgi:hypothetical protein